MNTIYVMGHKNPDTDSICSAIAYSYFKRIISPQNNYFPVRLGPVNNETGFVFDYFKEPVPELIENLYTQLSDIAFDEPVSVKKETPLSDVWNIMGKNITNTVNVVDEEGFFIGLVTVGDIARASLEISEDLSRVAIPLENIERTLDGQILCSYKKTFSGNILVAAMELATLERRLDEKTLIIVDDREDVQISVLKKEVHTLIITGGSKVSDQVLNLAKEKKVNLITVPYHTFTTVKRIGQSIPVQYVAKSQSLITFSLQEEVDDAKEIMLKHKYRQFPILDNKIPVGMLSRRNLLNITGKKVILVDHNEESQSAEGLEQAQILEVIDHHRIGSIETLYPIVFINRPVGCTATIVYGFYRDNGIKPPSSIAGLMCAAIISDTLMFKSPTSSTQDREAAQELATIAGMDIETFSRSMFEAGTSLEGKSAEEIFFTDFKIFDVADFKVGISQVFFYNTERSFHRKALLDFMKQRKFQGSYDMLLLMLTDIINEGSEILYVGNHEEFLSSAFGVPISGGSFYLPKVISRKKQVIPQLLEAIKRS
ncbi:MULTISPECIES: putative manganese-dependent inorganic diphosphatase [Aminobacterium]|jgi:manganese-dependent inorganic pyrophosphatase|uniref:putative manganese-dependent inorganic diphosphatase n=1 Tax=Aminobacterium TaxID=81466 RepID=UPI0023570D73|nr:putative manganese-dependent inorganic diphosphatase [Aminobacterium sp. UBA4987]